MMMSALVGVGREFALKYHVTRHHYYAEVYVASQAIVNHISGSKAGVAGVYNRASYLPEKREALKRWGAYVTGLVGAPLSQHQKKNAETQLKLDPQHSAGQSTRDTARVAYQLKTSLTFCAIGSLLPTSICFSLACMYCDCG